MEHLPGDVRVDAELIVEHLRALIAESPSTHPRNWVPTATFEELLGKTDREPIHLHPSIHYLHRHWNMAPMGPPPGGKHPRNRFARYLHKMVGILLSDFFQQERDFRAALAQSIDAIAYRVDDIASADVRNLLELVRDDLFSLARYVEEQADQVGPPADER